MNKKIWLSIVIFLLVVGGAYFVSGRNVLGSWSGGDRSGSSGSASGSGSSKAASAEVPNTFEAQPKPQAFTPEIAPKNDSITRSQLAYLLTNAAGLVPQDPGKCGKDVSLTLAPSVTKYSASAICAVLQKNIMTLDSNGNFNPYAYLNRAQAASYFHQTFDPYGGVVFNTPMYKDTPAKNYPYIVWLAYYKAGDVVPSPMNNFFPSTNLTIGRAIYWIQNSTKNVPKAKWAK